MDKPKYKEYKAHDKNVNGALIKTQDGRFYIESTPHRYKYIQAILFIIFTAAAIVTSIVIGSGYLSIFYLLIMVLVLWPDNYLKYILAGFKQVAEDYFKNQVIKKSKPSFADIWADSIKLDETERKEVPRNYIFCPEGCIFEEMNFRIYHKVWNMLWSLLLAILMVIVLLIDFLSKNANWDFYKVIALSLYNICVFIVFPFLRWRFNRFKEVNINEVIKEEEYQPRPIIE